MLGVADKKRVLAVGDSFRTDIKGARGAGLDCAFIPGGIHANELGVAMGKAPSPTAIADAIAKVGAPLPSYILPELRW
jgi:ribonucleotide monophosphatase NagD (HAD superfamily)